MKYITTKEASVLLGVIHRRVRAMVTQGHFPHAKRCGCERNNTLIPVEDLQNYIDKKKKRGE